uniref:hypothetical protein n=1 Tax=Serratia marcescens TaxID=615 RepID=UPI001CA35EA3
TNVCLGMYTIYSKVFEIINNGGISGVENIDDGDAVNLINILGIFIAAVYNHDHELIKMQHNKLLPFLPS